MSILQVNNLAKHFGGLVAVKDLSLSIKTGEIRGLIGPNGCGKTTTMNMLAGLYRPTYGDVQYHGKSIGKLPPHVRTAQGIMRTFQIPKLFSEMTVEENMLVPALATSTKKTPEFVEALEQKAAEKLAFCKLDHVSHLLAKQLSGGQRMLLQIARGLMVEGLELFLMDEPFAGINQVIKETIMDAIVDMNDNQGITFLIVSHEMSSVRRLCQTVSVMHEGSLIAEGSMKEIANDPLVIEAYLGGQNASSDS
ncbi:MAG: ABC transporter ATP-binding protein [SAR324 cluster bacterium]|jgi:branched-chain amino acid transport system ATP-binding protein|nr:ABC transporter ATP-binding protein [SAR324 cluster bacterium]